MVGRQDHRALGGHVLAAGAAQPEEQQQEAAGGRAGRASRPTGSRRARGCARGAATARSFPACAMSQSTRIAAGPLRCGDGGSQGSLNGALAGGLAAGVWAAQQPADKRAFDSGYDDVELLGKAVTRGEAWPAAGWPCMWPTAPRSGPSTRAAARSCPARLVGRRRHHGADRARGPVAAGPPGRPLPPRAQGADAADRQRRAFAQAAWRHLLFGLVLGELERRLNPEGEDEPPEVPVSSNGHGNIELAVGASEAS